MSMRIGAVTAGVLILLATGRAQQAGLPTARQIVDRHIQAMGGLAAFKAVQSIRARGTLSITSRDQPKPTAGEFEILTARPNKSRVSSSIPEFGKLEQGYDGKVAWVMDYKGAPSILTDEALATTAENSLFDAPLRGSEYVREMTVLGREAFDGRPAYKISLLTRAGTRRTEYFDVETGFLLGFETSSALLLASITSTTTNRDYRQFGTLKLPVTVMERSSFADQLVAIAFTSYELNVVPASAFNLPPAVRALIK